MSARRSGIRRGVEIGVSAAGLVLLFVWVQGLLGSRIGPQDGLETRRERYEGPTAEVRVREIPVRREASGTVRAVREATVASQVMGVIERIAVDEGDRVTRGQVLVVQATPELRARREAADQAVAAAEAARRQAVDDHRRMEDLLGKGAATRLEWERARTALAVAEADLSAARETARAEAARAGHAELVAPFDGLVVERNVDPGALAAPGSPILRIVDDTRYRLEAIVDEEGAARLDRGTPVRVGIDAIGSEFEAIVEEIVPAADPASRTVMVKVGLPAAAGLRTGRFGRMTFDAGSRRGVVVPSISVRKVGGLDLVQVVDASGVAAARYVRTGSQVGDGDLEIVAGLSEGERVALGARNRDE